MDDKARLLSFRISSTVNVYYLEDFFDYFYGYMVPDTGYVSCFGLELYGDGFVLRLPDQSDPEHLAPFQPSHKVFRDLYDASLRAQALRVTNVGEMNAAISEGQTSQMIFAHEAMMEKQIGDIAEEIAGRKHVRFVMIAGAQQHRQDKFEQNFKR